MPTLTAAYTITIGGVLASGSSSTLVIARNSFNGDDVLGQRATAHFELYDLAGAFRFTQGMPVVINDADGIRRWSGHVFSDVRTRETFPNSGVWVIKHTIDCTDNVYRADKRIAARSYNVILAGGAVADLAISYLAPEGVLGTRTPPTFARASTAYRASDGVQVTSGNPRYEPGTIGGSSALRIEEAVTNLLSANQSSIETDTTGFSNGLNATVTRVTTQHWSGAAAIQYARTSTTGDNLMNIAGGVTLGSFTYAWTASAGTAYTFSAWAKSDGTSVPTLRITFLTSAGGVISEASIPGTTSTNWNRIVNTVTAPATTAGVLLRLMNNHADTNNCWFDGIQWEQHGYATSWQIGGTARVAETARIPVAGLLNPNQGTIQFRAYFDTTVRSQTTGRSQHLFNVDRSPSGVGSVGLELFHQAASANWTLQTGSGAGNTSANFADSNTPDGWHHITVAWDSASAIVYVDGTAQATISTPNLPAAFLQYFYFGSDGAGANQADTLYQDLRISSRKRTDAEIAVDAAASGFAALDDSTVYLATFNSTLAMSGSIEDGPTVNEIIVNYAPVSDAIQQLAEVSNKWWNIDLNLLLHFHDRATLAAPMAISGATMEEDDKVSVEDTAPLYRNRQFIAGGTDMTSSQVEVRNGDGTTRAFTLSYPIAKVPTVEVNLNGAGYVAKTVGIKAVDTGKDWYWSAGDSVLAQDTGGAVLRGSPTLDLLRVTYQGQFPLVYVSEDTSQVVANQATEGGGTTGYVDAVDTVSGTTSSTSSAQYAAGKLLRYAQGGVVVTFTTRTPGFKSGQLADVSLASHGISHQQMLIESVSAYDSGVTIWYQVKCVAGPVNSTWLDFFTELIQRASTVDVVNIGAGGTLVIAATVSETWTWNESVTQTVQACPIFPMVFPFVLC